MPKVLYLNQYESIRTKLLLNFSMKAGMWLDDWITILYGNARPYNIMRYAYKFPNKKPKINLDTHLHKPNSTTFNALLDLQNGLCFHCNKPMIGGYEGPATREHIFPRVRHGKKRGEGIANCPTALEGYVKLPWVLAHSTCNNKRGKQRPTPDEIQRALILWDMLSVNPWK